MARLYQFFVLLVAVSTTLPAADLRPPATPLVTHDPYFSIWSAGDALNGSPTRHWTGSAHELNSMIRIDGQTFRLLGANPRPDWRIDAPAPPMEQHRLRVLPTRTIYEFAGAGVAVSMTFLTPALPDDLDVLSRPATYLTWEVRSTDGSQHDVSLYFDASGLIAVNDPSQEVVTSRYRLGDLEVLRAGSREQPVLEKEGDNVRIDWGYLYTVAPPKPGTRTAVSERFGAYNTFVATGRVPEDDELEATLAKRYQRPVLAHSFDLGKVGGSVVSRYVVIAYDDLYSIEYLHCRLRPYWRRNGLTAAEMLKAALVGYASLSDRCRKFDEELMADLRTAGGEAYAEIAALAYRQTLAAHKLTAGAGGKPLLFSKENHSNGSIATVDVTYPSAPFFLLLNTELMRAMIEPILHYAGAGRWKFPFAPHDLGTYPRANGQTYGGGETSEARQMPVEESGNMLILVAAAAIADGDTAFTKKYWQRLTQWAAYLKEKGLDPENQLCTDDFAGHLAHNANLSLKAIMGLASYARLSEMTGRAGQAAEYRKLAEDFVKQWLRLADDGDHYVLAFGNPGTWSQKYNLVWDRLLGFNMFPPGVARKEIAYYKKVQNTYGLPLDNRSKYTKLDWIFWTATLAESGGDFRALTEPVYKFLNETPDRYPMTDWYWSHNGRRRGFTARSVVGGVYIKMLAEKALWKKWVNRARR